MNQEITTGLNFGVGLVLFILVSLLVVIIGYIGISAVYCFFRFTPVGRAITFKNRGKKSISK